jgi:hypothetical protein
LLKIDSNKIEENGIVNTMLDYSFVKVTAKTTFFDVHKIKNVFSTFNKMGEALAVVQTGEIRTEYAQKIATTAGKEQAKLKRQLKEITDSKKLASSLGLQSDDVFLESLSFLTDYGLSDQLELRQQLGKYIFSSCLKRDFLRENEELLVRKFSRKTEKEIVLLGIITQSASKKDPTEEVKLEEPNSDMNIKSGINYLVEKYVGVEESLCGKQENEIMIDPIAAYIEI